MTLPLQTYYTKSGVRACNCIVRRCNWLITVGGVLLSCVFAVLVSHLPTGNVHLTREQAIAKQCSMSPRAMQDDFLRYIAILSKNQINVCPILVLSWVSVGAMTTCTNPKLQVTHELEYRVLRSAGINDGEVELRARRETRGVELKNPSAEELNSGTTMVTQL